MTDQNFTCAHCNGAIAPRINKTTGLPSKAVRKFCSPKCSERFHDARRGPRKRSPHKPKPVQCEHCSKTVLRRVTGGGKDAGRFCSRDCAFAWLGTRRAEREARLSVEAKVRLEVAALKRIAAYVGRPAIFRSSCRHCGAEMIVRRNGGLHKKVCATCTERADRAARIAHKLRRRAIKRGIEADSIDPIKVFERDKWRCHICGTKTVKKHRGTQHDRAPELEHIVALADGGTHTWGNVACSCRKCNQEKGAASFGQLGLRIAA